jgi:protein tyrosine phosphatase
MQNILNTNLYLGSKNDYYLTEDKTDWVFVHCCNSFYKNLDQKYQNNNKVAIINRDLYIDWEDLPDINSFEISDFILAMDFLDKYIETNKILIHCDWGQSRSPTLVLVYLAKRLKLIPNTFIGALEKFVKIYPDYHLPSGISKFVKLNWGDIE